MKKYFKPFVFLFLITILSTANVFAKSGVSVYASNTLATAPPTGKATYYYCIGDNVPPLTAVGTNLLWYATATGGTGSSVAPTPSTAVAGSKAYYVSQTVGGEESSRLGITINVNVQIGLFCDKPKATLNSVEFDFSNVGQTSFNYSYTVSGGSPITGTWFSPSHFAITGLSPGQSVTYTITAIGAPPCVIPTQTDTCYTICTTAQKVTPSFLPIIPTSYCLSDVLLPLPTISNDSPPITGTWGPFPTVDTSTMGIKNYTFTPDKVSFPCALTKTLSIAIGPIEPDFTNFPICSGDVPPILNTVSPNGITGTWNPSIVDNMTNGTYDFTPDPGQPCTPITTIKTINVTVNPSNTIASLNWTVTEAFSKNQIVTVTDPVGANYLYQLDNGPFQTNSIFENVALGIHSLTVKHIDGCSTFSDNNVLVVGYPKYFTPNGDGYNDTWNISTLSAQLNSRIYIFDRYGKLLKDLSPTGSGWDGTYIGRQMPADDYWFTVEYVELSIVKKYKSHFSLKR